MKDSKLEGTRDFGEVKNPNRPACHGSGRLLAVADRPGYTAVELQHNTVF
jgi:hypothetical protein